MQTAYAGAEPFVSVYAGASIPHASEMTVSMYGYDMNFELDLTPGPLVGANAGAWFDKYDAPFMGVMFDINASYPELDTLSFGGYSADVTGDANIYQATANIMFRVPTGPIRPYFGAGGGLYWINLGG